MRISNQQLAKLRSLRCRRLKDITPALLTTITGPVVRGEIRTEIVDLFRSKDNITDEHTGVTASYVIQSPNGEILSFFSIRSGELFTLADDKIMQLAKDAWHAYGVLTSTEPISPETEAVLRDKIMEAAYTGLSIDEIEAYAEKGAYFSNDEMMEPNKSINRVYEAYPGVELKLLGTNEAAKPYWKSLGMHRKMGETLFWFFVIPTLISIQKIVGIQYLYLFAADEEADGALVNYYKTRLLHIDETALQLLSTNKPLFDRECRFLYQSVEKLTKQRKCFFDDFNPDSNNILA